MIYDAFTLDPLTIEVMFMITIEDIIAMTQTIYGEARNQPYMGMVAVGKVILARSRRDRISIWEVVHKKKQFSCWNHTDLNLYILSNNRMEVMLREMQAALQAINDITFLEELNEATHYHTVSIKPYWAKGHKPVKIIGDHAFYVGIK
jgi:spore germination cell wall hydrolase CwlJ-like protein